MRDLVIRIIDHQTEKNAIRVEVLNDPDKTQGPATDLEKRVAADISFAVTAFLRSRSTKFYCAAGDDRDKLERDLDVQKALDPDNFK